MNNKMFFYLGLSVLFVSEIAECNPSILEVRVVSYHASDKTDVIPFSLRENGYRYVGLDEQISGCDFQKVYVQNIREYADSANNWIAIKGGLYNGIKIGPCVQIDSKNKKEFIRLDQQNYEIFKKNFEKYEGKFCLQFINPGQTYVISLELDEKMIPDFLEGKYFIPESSFSKIALASFSIIGLAALLYYFDLYSKGMALLGRG